jgi:hypothetical protein
VKFQTSTLKFKVIPNGRLQSVLEEIVSIENMIRCHLEMADTEIIARDHLN